MCLSGYANDYEAVNLSAYKKLHIQIFLEGHAFAISSNIKPCSVKLVSVTQLPSAQAILASHISSWKKLSASKQSW